MLVASWGGRGRRGDPSLWAIGRAQSGRAGARHLGHPGVRGQSRTEPEASPQQLHASAGEVPVAAGTWHCRLQRFCALPVALAAQAWALGNVQLNKTQPLRAVEVSSRCGDEDTGNHPHEFPGPWPHMSTRGCSHRNNSCGSGGRKSELRVLMKRVLVAFPRVRLSVPRVWGCQHSQAFCGSRGITPCHVWSAPRVSLFHMAP